MREALWGKNHAFDDQHPLYLAIKRLSEIRDTQPALRYGRLYFRPISGDGVHFGVSPFAPGVLAYSRILNNQEVIVIANANVAGDFQGYVLVDSFLHQDGDQFHVCNDASMLPPGSVESRTGLEIHEIEGGITTGPARMLPVHLQPMEVQILVKVCR